MTPLKILIGATCVAAGLMTVCEPASARGRHGHGYRHHPSVNFSFGYWGGPRYWGHGWGYGGSGWGYGGPGWGYWGPPAVVYAPSQVIVPQEPRVWVESDQAVATPPVSSVPSDANAPQWWYWCVSARGYYPYVSSCAEGWQRVAPQPTPAAR